MRYSTDNLNFYEEMFIRFFYSITKRLNRYLRISNNFRNYFFPSKIVNIAFDAALYLHIRRKEAKVYQQFILQLTVCKLKIKRKNRKHYKATQVLSVRLTL